MPHYLTTTGSIYGTAGHPVQASDLDADHIGHLIHFSHVQDVTALEVLVFGELREVYHRIHHSGEGTDHEVIILVTGRDNTGGDKEEFTLTSAAPIVFIV